MGFDVPCDGERLAPLKSDSTILDKDVVAEFYKYNKPYYLFLMKLTKNSVMDVEFT